MKDPIDFYKLSAIPSPPDPNDYKVTRLVPLLNTFPVYHSIKYNSVAKNQGDIGSCVPHSISCLKEIIEEKQSGEFRLFSPGFVYANRRNTDFQGEGMVPSQALYNLRHHGIVHQEDFPYNEEYPGIKNLLSTGGGQDILFAKAEPFRISSYCKVNNLNELRTALLRVGPISGCFPIYESFFKLDKKDYTVKYPSGKETFFGYHEMTLLTFNNAISHFEVLNSWGPEWGLNGYCLVPFDYPTVEYWSVSDDILPNPAGDDKRFFILVMNELFKFKESANLFLQYLLSKGFKDTVLNFDEETDYFEIQIASGFNSEELIEVQKLTDMLDVKTKIIYR